MEEHRTNKANFDESVGWTRGAVVQTKPIPAGRVGRSPADEGCGVLNKQTQFAESSGRGKCLATKELW